MVDSYEYTDDTGARHLNLDAQHQEIYQKEISNAGSKEGVYAIVIQIIESFEQRGINRIIFHELVQSAKSKHSILPELTPGSNRGDLDVLVRTAKPPTT